MTVYITVDNSYDCYITVILQQLYNSHITVIYTVIWLLYNSYIYCYVTVYTTVI